MKKNGAVELVDDVESVEDSEVEAGEVEDSAVEDASEEVASETEEVESENEEDAAEDNEVTSETEEVASEAEEVASEAEEVAEDKDASEDEEDASEVDVDGEYESAYTDEEIEEAHAKTLQDIENWNKTKKEKSKNTIGLMKMCLSIICGGIVGVLLGWVIFCGVAK